MLLVMLSLLGCDAIQETVDLVDGVGERRVVAGLVLDVAPPDDPALAGILDQADQPIGPVATAFLAFAEQPDALDDIPYADARVTLGDADVQAPLESQGDGSYVLSPDDTTLVYTPGESWTLDLRDVDGADASVTLTLPEAVDVGDQLAGPHPPDTPLVFTVDAPDIQQVLVIVMDSSGDVTYSNEPRSIDAVYRFTRGTFEPEVTIPASAFPGPDVYAVAVAGLAVTDAGDLSGLNSVLSGVASGRMTVHPVEALGL